MPTPQHDAINKELHPQAEALARNYVNEFAVSLLLQAKTTAHQRKADIVLSSHIDEARDLVFSEQRQSWANELRIAFGGALVGAFLQGFANELSLTALRPGWIAIYVVGGFIGTFLIYWGLKR
ncbi:MAG: hypothetical protein H8D34_13940 [Chloroflexi bacterium]|nr:hypothetical protein [Chloroflexota bacterium]